MEIGKGRRWTVTEDLIEFDGVAVAVAQIRSIDTRVNLPRYQLFGLVAAVACTPSALVGVAGESLVYFGLMVFLAACGIVLRLAQRRTFSGVLHIASDRPVVYTSPEGRDVADFVLCAGRAARERAKAPTTNVFDRRFRADRSVG